MKKILIIGGLVVMFIALLAWLFIASTKPAPGEKIAYNCDNFIDFSQIQNSGGDKCRIHISDGMKVNYSTNPPTFGPHYSSWITKGFYETPRFDGNLVHSMEHGYIIIWYDCDKKASALIPVAYAQDAGMTGGYEGSPSASLESMPKAFSDGSCDSLKKGIKDLINKFGPHKLIGVPRVGMDHRIILTAWDRIFKLDSLDEAKIKDFISAFRDAGPENTVEP